MRQSQVEAVRRLLHRGNYRAAISLAKRRCVVIQNRLKSVKRYYSDRSDEQLIFEDGHLTDLILECQAHSAEQRNSWSKAAALWRRLDQPERAKAAAQKEIEAIEDPLQRGIALLRARNPEKALELFEAAGSTEWATRARGVQYYHQERWLEAAELFKSIGDEKNWAAAMAQHAAQMENGPKPPAGIAWLDSGPWRGRLRPDSAPRVSTSQPKFISSRISSN